jgi:DNA-directed RNA polymerase beta' subunit
MLRAETKGRIITVEEHYTHGVIPAGLVAVPIGARQGQTDTSMDRFCEQRMIQI